MTTLRAKDMAAVFARLHKANAEFAERYPGDSPRRQPVHTVYGGAHVFRSDSAPKLGGLALRSLDLYAPDAAAFAGAIGLPENLAPTVYRRIREKLEREPVEDFRIDFEDGYGVRPDAEEDAQASSAAREMTIGLAAKTLPPHTGIRIKPFTEELKIRAIRTLDIFLTELVAGTGGNLPENFVVTLPKVVSPEQVATLASLLLLLEEGLKLPENTIRLEIMVETPQSILNEWGEVTLLPLVAAAEGRCTGAHFGTYDYTASLAITASEQRMDHPACDFARHAMQVALAGTGVFLSDGATNVLPVVPLRGDRTLSSRELLEDRATVHAAWKLHYEHVRRSLALAFYQGWDLHPAQLPTRYAALYSFFLEGLDAASARLTNFVEKAGQATLVGEVFDDAATGQGLLNYFLRAWNCGAITEQEAVAKSGLSFDELRGRSFAKILKSRRAG